MKSSAIQKSYQQVRSIGSRLWTPRNLSSVIAWYSFRQYRNSTGTAEYAYDFCGQRYGTTLRQATENRRPAIAGPSSDIQPKSKHLVFSADTAENLMADSSPADALDFGTGDFIFCCAIHVAEEAITTNNTIMALQRAGNTEEIRIFLQSNGNLSAKFGDGTTATAGSCEDGNPHIITVTRINAKLQAFVDGVGGVERDNTVDIDNDADTVLGALTTSGAQEFNGDLAEICFGGTSTLGGITQKDRLRLEGFTAHRVGISSVLADTHPYKSAPPRI